MKKKVQSEYIQEEYCADLQGVQTVIVEIASLPVEIKSVESNVIKVRFPQLKSTDVISTETHEETYKFHHEIQKFSFPFTGIQHFHDKVYVEIPRNFHGNLSVIVSNGAIQVNSLPELKETKFVTTNAAIILNCFKCLYAFVQSKNGAIQINSIVSGSLSVETCNAPITGTIIGDMRDYAVESHTTVGTNTMPTIPFQGQENVLKIENRNGQIDIKFVH